MKSQINSFKGEYAFLSNFYDCEVLVDGIRYPSVEHAFQAGKTLDMSIRKSFSCAPTPKDAKKCGRQIALREDWDKVKDERMLECLRAKFSVKRGTMRNTGIKYEIRELRDKLLDTKDSELIEGNNHGDKYWGQVKGEGQNKLGKLLMQVREEIRKEEGINL